MGIPRFYKWLKTKYPLIRMDLADKNKQLPIFDHFYIDFNALIYQCIRQSNCFLRNKIKPLTFQEIYERVWSYLLELMQVVNPQELLYIALDGVAPRAKINQSRDRRFKSAKDDEIFEEVLAKIGVENKENFMANSISPGTKFLNDLCSSLKQKVLQEMETNWKHLKVMFSDCGVPGQGQHKIMDFLRYSEKHKLFHPNTTYCVYSPDADVILLTLSLQLKNMCLIKQDTSGPMGPNWTATTVYRKAEPKQFELVMINILRQYFEKQFAEVIRQVKGCTIQQIIDDLILLMAFVGNDFLPVEFCFTLKDNHIENLFISYKVYLRENKQFINKRGLIDWENIYKLLEIGKKFEANMISEMIIKRKQRGPPKRDNQAIMAKIQKQVQQGKSHNNNIKSDPEDQGDDIEHFQVQDNKVVKGRGKYYSTRFGIEDIQNDPKYKQIINSYIEGLEFYCQYYFQGLPTWSWFYPYHFTPMLTDVYEHLKQNKVNIRFPKSVAYDPFLALMFMMPLKSIQLLPKPLHNMLLNKEGQLRKPIDYFPDEFQLDRFQTLRYNKRAIIEFLDEKQVRKMYESVQKNEYSVDENKRNQLRKAQLILTQKSGRVSINPAQIQAQQTQKYLKQMFKGLNIKKSQKLRFPSLQVWGDFTLEDGKIVTHNKYKHQGNPGQTIYFNNFLGQIQDVDNQQQYKTNIEKQYQISGIKGKCQFYYTVKRVNYTRQVNRFALVASKKQVIVPDFAVTRLPNCQFVRKTQMKPFEEQYQNGQIVVLLDSKYFGYRGVIQKMDSKSAQVRITNPPINSVSKIQQYNGTFFTVDYVLNELNIKFQTLLAIMDQTVVLPQFKKSDPYTQAVPTSMNFSLNLIDSKNALLVPRFVRCQMQYENTYKPGQIFKKMEISKLCLQFLQQYIQQFDWLVQYIEDMVEKRKYTFRRPLYTREIFADHEEPNIKMYQEFIKLYKFKNEGSFYSIYAKTYQKLPAFKQAQKINQTVTAKHYQMISQRQARIAPPALRYEPQYHNIGDKIILLRTLQTGYIVGIDDNIIHIRVGLNQKHYRVRFHEIFNEHWSGFLCVEEGKSWNLQSSYYAPSYWKKAVDIDGDWEDEVSDIE